MEETVSRCVAVDSSTLKQQRFRNKRQGPLARLRVIHMDTPAELPPTKIIVKVLATSIDFYDLGLLRSDPPINLSSNKGILGRSGAGIVLQVNKKDCHSFQKGDRVYFAQEFNSDGTYQEFLMLDAKVVAIQPQSLSSRQAAALPLDCLTLYIALNEKAALSDTRPVGSLLISRADHPQGLGPLAVQYCRSVLGIRTIFVTLLNPHLAPRFIDLGAIPCNLANLSNDTIDVVLSCGSLSPELFDTCCNLIKPNGKIVSFRASKHPLRMPNTFFNKSATLSYELMFTHVMFGDYPEMKGEILSLFTSYVDQRLIVPIAREWPSPVNLWTHHNAVHQFANNERSVFGKLVISLEGEESEEPENSDESFPQEFSPIDLAPLSSIAQRPVHFPDSTQG